MEVSECYITFVCASNIDEKVFFSGAFRKPLINEMAAAGLHLYPHAAISDIRYAEEEWDKNHLSDKCYLISAVVQTVIQVCLVSFMTKAVGFL